MASVDAGDRSPLAPPARLDEPARQIRVAREARVAAVEASWEDELEEDWEARNERVWVQLMIRNVLRRINGLPDVEEEENEEDGMRRGVFIEDPDDLEEDEEDEDDEAPELRGLFLWDWEEE